VNLTEELVLLVFVIVFVKA